MNTFFKLTFLGFLFCACVQSAPETSFRGSQSETKTVKQSSTAQVELSQSGQTLFAYESPGAIGLLDEGFLTIEMNSPDQKHSLVIQLDNPQAGTYELSSLSEESKAVFLLLSESLPLTWSPDSGLFTITDWGEEGLCSGSFSGKRRSESGAEYLLSGSFTDIPVKKL